MSELKSLLERASDHLNGDEDAFVQLDRARSRRHTRRRLTAGVVAFVIAVAGTAAALTAFTGAPPQTRPVAQEPHPFRGIWPETTLEQLRNATHSPEGIGYEEPWRLTIRGLLRRFGHEVLGWRHVLRSEIPPDTIAANAPSKIPLGPKPGQPYRVLIADCATAEHCSRSRPNITLTLEQLLSGSTLWSVTGVESSAIHLDLRPGVSLHQGEVVDVAVEPHSQPGFGGGLYLGPNCRGNLSSESHVPGRYLHLTGVEPVPSRVRVSIPQSLEGCGPPIGGFIYIGVPRYGNAPRDLLPSAAPFGHHGPLLALAAVPIAIASTGPTSTPPETPSVPPSGTAEALSGAVEGTWYDAQNRPLGIDFNKGDGAEMTFVVRAGAEHCGWQSTTTLGVSSFLLGPQGSTGVPGKPGSDPSPMPGYVEYIRDPNGVFSHGELLGRFAVLKRLPQGATYSGFHRGEWQLWIRRSTLDQSVYIVGPNTVERWPRAKHQIGCE